MSLKKLDLMKMDLIFLKVGEYIDTINGRIYYPLNNSIGSRI